MVPGKYWHALSHGNKGDASEHVDVEWWLTTDGNDDGINHVLTFSEHQLSIFLGTDVPGWVCFQPWYRLWYREVIRDYWDLTCDQQWGTGCVLSPTPPERTRCVITHSAGAYTLCYHNQHSFFPCRLDSVTV